MTQPSCWRAGLEYSADIIRQLKQAQRVQQLAGEQLGFEVARRTLTNRSQYA